MERPYSLIKIKPFEDMRGKLIKIAAKSKLEQKESIAEVYVLYTKKGAVRGNHYHKETVEYFSVLSGIATIELKDLNTGKSTSIILSSEDNTAIRIPQFVVHAFKNECEQPLILIAVSTREYNAADTDTFLEELLI